MLHSIPLEDSSGHSRDGAGGSLNKGVIVVAEAIVELHLPISAPFLLRLYRNFPALGPPCPPRRRSPFVQEHLREERHRLVSLQVSK